MHGEGRAKPDWEGLPSVKDLVRDKPQKPRLNLPLHGESTHFQKPSSNNSGGTLWCVARVVAAVWRERDVGQVDGHRDPATCRA